MKEANSFRKEVMKENNEILKETTASEPFSKRANDSEKRDKSVRECTEDTVTKITIADELNETQSLLREFPSNGSKREIKNSRKISTLATTEKHRCQRPFRDIIGKREQRREELDKMQGDLRQRLNMLECSIPAVMVWNIWRMSQSAPVCKIKRILEKQFKDTRELSCRSTPSCHYDCRIREVEAERKLALKKVEEARTLWSEKLVTLEERKRKLDEAKRIQEEQKIAMERLNEETKELRQAVEEKPMEMGELCQCGDTQCKQRHLSKVSSVMSVESGDIQCLEKLQRLAEEEVMTKREIAELERREETYMRTLQQADELWSKMEGDMISTTNGLQEQLDMKTAANQQLANRVCELEDALEKCQTRLATCRAELEKFLSIEKVEAPIGRDDDVALVVDKEVAVRVKVIHRLIGREDDVATVKDAEVLARVEVADKEVLARAVLTDVDVQTTLVENDKFISVKPDLADLAIDRPADLVQIEESIVRPEYLAYEQQRYKEVREYLSKLGSLEELYKNDGEPCAPDFVCNDVVSSPTGMTDEELITLGVKDTVPKEHETVSNYEREKQFQQELVKKGVVNDIKKREEKKDEIPSVEIERKVVEEMEKQFADMDVPIKEVVTPRTIDKEAADDKLITIPKERAEINKIEADQGIVIQRDTILSWIDTIDTIRMTAARHPNCREVKKDADILAEQVGTYIGIKPKEVRQENAIIKEDELIILKAKEMEPVTKIESIPLLNSEETSTEIEAPMESIAESELLSTLTKEEVPIGMEPSAVSMEDSFQPPTIHNKKDLKDDMVSLAIPEPYKDIKKIRPEETRIENLNSTDKEETLVVPKIEKEEQEVISNHVERNGTKEKDVPTETKREEIIVEKIGEMLPVSEMKKNEFVEVVEKLKDIPQLDETKMIDIKETIPHMEIAVEEKIETEEPVLRKEEIKTIELPLITDIKKEQVEVELSPIEDIEKKEDIKLVTLPPILDVAKEEKIEVMELSIEDIEKKEAINAEELLPADIITEEKIEIIQPIPTLPIMKREKEIEAAEEPMLKEIKKEKDEEIEEKVTLPEEVTPFIELPEKKEEEEIPPVEKKEILMEVPSYEKPTIKDKKKVLVERKKPEVVQIELKIPIAEIKSTEIEMPAIPLDPQLVAQPYLIIAKFKEKELLQVIPTKQPCTGCYLQPLIERPVDIPQTDVLQTEIVRAEVVQTEMMQTKIVQNEIMKTEIVQTETVETEVAQITTQTVSTAEPSRTPPIRIISEYLKPVELKTSRTEITDDHPEITGRKMLWHKRLKDQSTVTTASTGSQTDKTSHVSHDRVVRDERERARVPTDELLRSIKIAAGLMRPDTEREIRTINYSRRSEEMGKVACNCCLCGRTPTLPSTGPRLEIEPQIDAKTATPPAVAAFKRMFIRPKIDHPIPHDRLCPDCKAKIQSRMPRERHHVEKIIKKISRDYESCGCASLTGKSCRAVPRKGAIEKRDQACLAKIPKRKSNPFEQKRKDDMQSILEDSEKFTIKPLSPSCICFKLEKTGVEPIKEGNCYCAD